MNLKTWTPECSILIGAWQISYKIDGVNVRIDELPYSKNEKVFDNLVDCAAKLSPGIYEFYRDNWSETMSLLKNRARKGEITADDFYRLANPIDPRLNPRTFINPNAALIQKELNTAIYKDKEGLVLTSIDGTIGYKVKPSITYDLRVIDVIEGKGVGNRGMLGVAITTSGKVATGFTKQQRIDYWKDPTFVGSIIEVSCTELTPLGFMRYARFIRRREDKNTENLEDLNG